MVGSPTTPDKLADETHRTESDEKFNASLDKALLGDSYSYEDFIFSSEPELNYIETPIYEPSYDGEAYNGPRFAPDADNMDEDEDTNDHYVGAHVSLPMVIQM